MKKTIAFAMALTVALASAQTGLAQRPERGDRPQRPEGGFMASARTDDGRLDLSKLPEQTPQERKDALKAADKDGDGFLTPEELRAMPRPKFRFNEGEKPDFINDDNAFIVDKTIEAIKAADKNGDGIIDADEQKAVADVVREKSPALPRFLAIVLGDFQNRFGAPDGARGFRPGQMGDRPQGDRRPGQAGDRPQGDRRPQTGDRQPNRRPQGDRPQNREGRRAPQA